MSGWQSHIAECVTTDFRNFKLLKSLDLFGPNGEHYRCPAFAPSDLASIPKEFWGAPLFLIPCGWYAFDCYAHDCAYQNTLQIVQPDGSMWPANLTKQQSDDLVKFLMTLDRPGIEPEFEALQAAAIYEGLAIGGWHAFKEDRS